MKWSFPLLLLLLFASSPVVAQAPPRTGPETSPSAAPAVPGAPRAQVAPPATPVSRGTPAPATRVLKGSPPARPASAFPPTATGPETADPPGSPGSPSSPATSRDRGRVRIHGSPNLSPDEPAPSETPALDLSLARTVRMALERNMDLLRAGYEPAIARAAERMEKGIFDPVLAWDVSLLNFSPQGAQPYTVGIPYGQDLTAQNGGITYMGGDGTIYSAQYQNGIVQGSNLGSTFPTVAIQPNTVLSITRPLLRNAGSVVQSRVKVARNQVQIAELAFRQRALDVAATAERGYWGLTAARQLVQSRRQALALAQELQRMVEEKIRLGRLPEYQANGPRQRVAALQTELFLAERNAVSGEQQLQRLLRLAITGPRLILTDPYPSQQPQVAFMSSSTLAGQVDEALKRRPEIQQAQLEVKSLEIQEKRDANNLLPQLNLVGEYRLGEMTTSVSNLYRYRFGVTFGMPFGNREAAGRYQRTVLQKQQAIANLENMRQAVALEVSDALANRTMQQRTLESSRQSRLAAQALVDAERQRFEYGLSSVENVLQAQDQLFVAQQREIVAMSDYETSLVALNRASGVSLEQFGLSVVPESPPMVNEHFNRSVGRSPQPPVEPPTLRVVSTKDGESIEAQTRPHPSVAVPLAEPERKPGPRSR